MAPRNKDTELLIFEAITKAYTEVGSGNEPDPQLLNVVQQLGQCFEEEEINSIAHALKISSEQGLSTFGCLFTCGFTVGFLTSRYLKK